MSVEHLSGAMFLIDLRARGNKLLGYKAYLQEDDRITRCNQVA
jgi:hypothetical protein